MIKNQSVSLGIARPIPSHRPLMANMATPIGWKTARCSSLGQPRMPHQMVVRMPARPVRPPRIPFKKPTPASTDATATLDGIQSAEHRSDSKSAHSTGLKTRLRIVRGSGNPAVEHRIGPDDYPVNILGGHRWPDAPKLGSTIETEVPIRENVQFPDPILSQRTNQAR